MPRARARPSPASFQGRDLLLQRGNGGIRKSRVYVPKSTEVEEVGSVFDVIKDVAGCLVDGRGAGSGDGVRSGSGVDASIQLVIITIYGHMCYN